MAANNLQEENGRIKEKLHALENKKKNYVAQVTEKDRKLEDRENTLRQLEAELKEAKLIKSKIDANEVEIGKLEQQIESWSRNRTNTEKELDDLHQTLSDAEKKSVDLTYYYETLQLNKENLKIIHETVDRENQQLIHDISLAQERIKNLEDSITKNRETLFTDTEVDKMVDRIKSTKIENQKLKTENQNFLRENEKLQDGIEDMSIDLPKQQLDKEILSAEQNDLEAKIKLLDENLVKKLNEVSLMEQKYEEFQNRGKINEDLQATVAFWTKQVENYRSQLEANKVELMDIRNGKKSNNGVANLEEEVNQLLKINEGLSNNRIALEDSDFDKLKTISELRLKLKNLK